MKKKELKNIAMKIAAAEHIIQTSEDPVQISKAENEVFSLSGKVSSLEDMMAIDEMVQDILNHES